MSETLLGKPSSEQVNLKAQISELRSLSLTAALLSGAAFLSMLRLATFPNPGSAEVYVWALFGTLFIVVPHMNLRSRISKLGSNDESKKGQPSTSKYRKD